MSDGSKMKLKAKRGPGGAIHLSVQLKDDESEKLKPPPRRGPGWRAKVREYERRRKEEAKEAREQRKRGRRRDRGNVRGRGR